MLSPRKINLLGKENESRDLGKSSTQKNSYEHIHSVLTRVISYISEQSIALPSEIVKNLPHSVRHYSIINKSPQKKTEKSKAAQIKALNDLKFQLKKVEEDRAEEILSLKLSHSKQIKKQRERYCELEATYLNESRNFEDKVSQIKQYYQKLIKEKEKQWGEKQEQLKKQLQGQYDKQIAEYQKQLSAQRQQIREETDMMIKEYEIEKQQKNIEIQQIIQEKEKDKEDCYQKYLLREKRLENLWECKRQNWQQQKNALNAKHEEQLIKLTKQKQKIYNDLYLVRKDNAAHKATISSLHSSIDQLQSQIEKLNKSANDTKIGHQKQLSLFNEKLNSRLQQEKHQYEKQLKQKLISHLKQLDLQEKKLEQLEQLKQRCLMQYQDRAIILQQTYDQRQPRKEDVEKIEEYQSLCIRKQIEMNQLREQYQRVILQRENNERNYNRIFSAHNTARKNHGFSSTKEPTKQGASRKVSRKPNTIDFSFILKTLNKNI